MTILLALVAGHWCLAAATTVSGTINRPDGTPVQGTIEFTLSQPAKTATPPIIYVPVKTTCAVTNGQIAAGCAVQGNDTLDPAGTFYRVRVLDANNREVFPATNYTLSGAGVDLGALPVTATDTLVPPTGAVTGDMNVTGNLTVGGSATFGADPQDFSHLRLLGLTADPATVAPGSIFHRSDLDRIRFRAGGLEIFDGTQYLPVTTPASQTFEFGGNIQLPGLFSAKFKRMNEIRLVDPDLWTETGVPAKIDAATADCAGAPCLVVYPSNLGAGEPTAMPDTVLTLDLRRTGGHRFTGSQDPGVRKGVELLGFFREAAAASQLWQPLQVHLTAFSGGINNTAGPKIQYNAGFFSLASKTRGQATALTAEIGGFAQGDTTAVTAVANCYGGINAGGDEGCVGARFIAQQGTQLFTATVASASFDALANETTLNYSSPLNEVYRGENRPVINLTTALTTPGSISAISGTPPVVTGSATTFCTSLGLTCPYTPATPDIFFSMAGDDGVGGEKLVVPVRTVTSDTSLTLDYSVAGADQAWSGATSGAYRLYRGQAVKRLVESGAVVFSGDVTSLFSATHSIEQPLGFDFIGPVGLRVKVARRLPTAIFGAGIDLNNLNPSRDIRVGYQLNGAGWQYGMRFINGSATAGPSIAAIQFDQPNSVTEGRIRWATSTSSITMEVDPSNNRLDLYDPNDSANQFNFFGSGLLIGSRLRARTNFHTNSTAGYYALGNPDAGTVPGSGQIRATAPTVGLPLLVTRNQLNTADVNLLTYSTADELQLAQAGSPTKALGAFEMVGTATFTGGVNNDGAALKHARVSTGPIAAGSSTAVTVTWTTAFADANYTVNCSVVEATASTSTLRLHHIESVTATAVVLRVINDDPANAKTGTLHCVALHN